MNYYENIKNELINNEVYKRVKDYSKNRKDLETYYNVGKLLSKAGKHYGEGIIKEYSTKLTSEFGKGYTTTNLKLMRQFFYYSKSHTVCDLLTWSHYRTLLTLKDDNEIDYLVSICISQSLSVRQLINKIRNKEYERLPEKTKTKLKIKDETKVEDLIKNPILIRNKYNYENISEKMLKGLILEDIPLFMKELGEGFSFIDSEYKIKIGDRYNYIDLLLYNIEFNCYVVVELKITELKKEYIGQIGTYMDYVDRNIKSINQDKTIGIIIVKKENKFIMEYCSNNKIFEAKYELV